MAGGIRLSFLLRAEEGVLGRRPQVLLVSLCSNLSLRLQDAVCRHYVPLGRSCTPSSIECNSNSDLVDRPVPVDIESFSVGSVLHLFVLVATVQFATQETYALLTYRTRLMFDDILACCAPCYLLATTRQTSLLLDCACVAWMLIAEVLQVSCSWTNVFSCRGVDVFVWWTPVQLRCS